MVQLQLNQGPQDALLYDNSRSYFTNVGYVRTSNFQIEYRDVTPTTEPNFNGAKAEFNIPKAADLLGRCDLMLDLQPATIPAPGDTTQPQKITEAGSDTTTPYEPADDLEQQMAFASWVDEVGLAAIDRVQFHIGNTKIEEITGEQMQITNELMRTDEARYGTNMILKTGKRPFSGTKSNELITRHKDFFEGNGTAEQFNAAPETRFDAHVMDAELCAWNFAPPTFSLVAPQHDQRVYTKKLLNQNTVGTNGIDPVTAAASDGTLVLKSDVTLLQAGTTTATNTSTAAAFLEVRQDTTRHFIEPNFQVTQQIKAYNTNFAFNGAVPATGTYAVLGSQKAFPLQAPTTTPTTVAGPAPLTAGQYRDPSAVALVTAADYATGTAMTNRNGGVYTTVHVTEGTATEPPNPVTTDKGKSFVAGHWSEMLQTNIDKLNSTKHGVNKNIAQHNAGNKQEMLLFVKNAKGVAPMPGDHVYVQRRQSANNVALHYLSNYYTGDPTYLTTIQDDAQYDGQVAIATGLNLKPQFLGVVAKAQGVMHTHMHGAAGRQSCDKTVIIIERPFMAIPAIDLSDQTDVVITVIKNPQGIGTEVEVGSAIAAAMGHRTNVSPATLRALDSRSKFAFEENNTYGAIDLGVSSIAAEPKSTQSRVIRYCHAATARAKHGARSQEGHALYAGAKPLIIPLGMYFTQHPSKFFPIAAIAGCNEIKITVMFKPLANLIQVFNRTIDPKWDIAPRFANGGIVPGSCKLRCEYVHVTGKEATDLMNKETVQMLKLWHKPITQTITGAQLTKTKRLTIPLNFLHPVTTLIITLRRDQEVDSNQMNASDHYHYPDHRIPSNNVSEVNYRDSSFKLTYRTGSAPPSDVAGINKHGPATPRLNSSSKGYFNYHGDGRVPDQGFPGLSLKMTHMQLSINGQERHPGLPKGLDVEFLRNRLMHSLHSNTSTRENEKLGILGGAYGINADYLLEEAMNGAKNIFVYPFSMSPEGNNPSGAVNFSKVSHAQLDLHFDEIAEGWSSALVDHSLRVDVHAIHYNWLMVKDGRALLSFT